MPRPWLRAAEVVDRALASKGERVEVAFGRRVVWITAEVERRAPRVPEYAHAPVLPMDALLVVGHGGTVAQTRGPEAAEALLEVARRGLLAQALKLGFEQADAHGDDASDAAPLWFLIPGLTPNAVAKRAEAAAQAAVSGPEDAYSVVRPSLERPFVVLPRDLVERVGYTVRRGTRAGDPKLDTAVLAVHGWYAKRNAGRAGTVEYGGGHEAEVGEHEYVLSEQRVAQTIYERLLYRRVLTPDPRHDDAFQRTYERVRDAHKRVKKLRVDGRAVLSDLGPAIPGKIRRGKRWSVVGGPLDGAALAPAPLLPYVLARPPEPPTPPQGAFVDAPSYLAALTATADGFLDEFAFARGRTALEGQRGRVVRGVRWARRQARVDPGGHRHLGVALFRKAELDVPGVPCVVPWVVLDIDRVNVDVAYVGARAILDDLARAGANLDDILVVHTGGGGFHVRIPAGALGVPVFNDHRNVSRILGRFVSRITRQTVDGATLSPRHLVRAVGSVHEKTGRRCVAFTGSEFVEYPLDRICEYAEHFTPYAIPDPLSVPSMPGLIEALRDAAGHTGGVVRVGTTSATISALLGGVGEGEPWHEHLTGRNEAAFRYACFLLHARSRSAADAWTVLAGWNQRNAPPLSRSELARAFRSAARYADRAAEARDASAGSHLARAA